MAVMGLATEVAKLSATERAMVIEWAAEDLAGRIPLAVTIFGATTQEQCAAVTHAAANGAQWVVLQPPRTPGITEAELIRFWQGDRTLAHPSRNTKCSRVNRPRPHANRYRDTGTQS